MDERRHSGVPEMSGRRLWVQRTIGPYEAMSARHTMGRHKQHKPRRPRGGNDQPTTEWFGTAWLTAHPGADMSAGTATAVTAVRSRRRHRTRPRWPTAGTCFRICRPRSRGPATNTAPACLPACLPAQICPGRRGRTPVGDRTANGTAAAGAATRQHPRNPAHAAGDGTACGNPPITGRDVDDQRHRLPVRTGP